MVSTFNSLLFGSAALSIGDMPVSILMALARVPTVELFDLVWYWWRTSVLRACPLAGSTKTRVCTKISSVIQLLFRGDVVEVTPPNHTSNKTEGEDLDNCDLILYRLVQEFITLWETVSRTKLIVFCALTKKRPAFWQVLVRLVDPSMWYRVVWLSVANLTKNTSPWRRVALLSGPDCSAVWFEALGVWRLLLGGKGLGSR